MAYTPAELAAIERMRQTRPADFDNDGHELSFPNRLNDAALALAAGGREATAIADDAKRAVDAAKATALDVVATGRSAANADADERLAADHRRQTGEDREQTGRDRAAIVPLAEATARDAAAALRDAGLTAEDARNTKADRLATAAHVLLTADDRRQTGDDRTTVIARATEVVANTLAAKGSADSAAALAAAFEIDVARRSAVPPIFDWRPEPEVAPASPLSFSRATAAWRFNRLGLFSEVASGALRHSYDAATGAYRGALIEEGRSNGVRNPRGEGAAGAAPANWFIAGGSGCAADVVGKGEEDSIPYVDVRVHGTTTANGTVLALSGEEGNGIIAANGQIWTGSMFLRLMAGSLANVAAQSGLRVSARTANAFVNETNLPFLPTNAPLRGQRPSVSHPFTTAESIRARLAYGVNAGTGVVIDFTIRVGLPQIEQGAFATSPILPAVGSPAVATRATDVLTAPLANIGFNPKEGSLLVDVEERTPLPSSGFEYYAGFSVGLGASEFLGFAKQSTGVNVRSSRGNTAVRGLVVGRNVMALTYGPGGISFARNGVFEGRVESAAGDFPNLTLLSIGRLAASPVITGLYRRALYWPRALSDADLQAITRRAA